MAKYFHKPFAVEAHQVPDQKGGEPHDFHEWADKVGLTEGMASYTWEQDGTLVIETGRGPILTASPGDWVVMDLRGNPHIYPSKNFHYSLIPADAPGWSIDKGGGFEAIKSIFGDDLAVQKVTLGPKPDSDEDTLEVSDDYVTMRGEFKFEEGEINWGEVANNAYEVNWDKVDSFQALKDIMAAQHTRFYPSPGKVEEDFPEIHRYLKRVGEEDGDRELGCEEIPLQDLLESVSHMSLDAALKSKLTGALFSTFQVSDIISRTAFMSVFHDIPDLRANHSKAVECWVKASNYHLDKQGVE